MPKKEKKSKLPKEFLDGIPSLTSDEIKKIALKESNVRRIIAKQLKNDQQIHDIQDQLKDIKAPYVEAQKISQEKIDYALQILEERGEAFDAKDLKKA